MISRIVSGPASLLITVVAAMSLSVHGQSTTPATANSVAFEASVIKPSGPSSGNGLSIKFLPGGRLVARNANLRLLIKIAYDLHDDEISGGPAWIGVKRFDIDAKADGVDDKPEQLRNRLLLQSLLRDRFQLKLRGEPKEIFTYSMVVSKSGPKLTKSPTPDGAVHFTGGAGTLTVVNANMDQLAAALEDWVGHPVQNMTALDGKYNFKLEWTPDQSAPSSPGNAPVDDSGPTIFAAVQQQLGLTLRGQKTQLMCQLVESVQLPSEN